MHPLAEVLKPHEMGIISNRKTPFFCEDIFVWSFRHRLRRGCLFTCLGKLSKIIKINHPLARAIKELHRNGKSIRDLKFKPHRLADPITEGP